MNLCSRFQLFAFLHTKDLFYLITSHPWTKYCVHKWWICAHVSSYLLFCTRRTFFTLSRVILWTKYCLHKWWICAHVSSYLLFCTRRTFFTLSRVIREPNIVFTNDEFVLTFLAICFFAHEGPFYLITSHPWTKYCVHKWWICAYVSSYLLFCTRRTFFTLSRVIREPNIVFTNDEFVLTFLAICFFAHEGPFLPYHESSCEPNIVFTNDEFVLTFPAICFFAHEGPFYLITSHPWTKYCVHKWWICAYVSSYLLFCTRRTFLPYHESSVNQILCSQMMNLCLRFQLFAFLHTKDLFTLSRVIREPNIVFTNDKFVLTFPAFAFLHTKDLFTLSRVIREPNIVFTNDKFVLTFPAICFFAHEGPFYLITSHPWTKYCVHKW